MKINKIKGFYLIEISVVLLIVSIFVAAISYGKILIDKSNTIQLQQALQSQLESQSYYSEKSFEVSVQDIKQGCGKNPSNNAIADFLYTQQFCCNDGTQLGSLCCSQGGTCTACGGTDQPNCLTPDP